MRLGHTGFLLDTRNLQYTKNGQTAAVLTWGKGSYIVSANYDTESLRTHVLIGNYSSLAHEISFIVGINHDYEQVTTFPLGYSEILKQFQILYPDVQQEENFFSAEKISDRHQIIIGNDVWIGARVTIMGGVKIGNGAVIGANSVVAKDIPPYAIAVGNPARVIKYRFDEETIKKFMAVRWWNWDLKKIFVNAPLMKNPEKFLEKHYSPQLEEIPEDSICEEVKSYRAEGRKIFSFIADFQALQPLWKRVVGGFCQSKLQKAVLIFGVSEGFTSEDIEYLENFLTENNSAEGKFVRLVPLDSERIFSPHTLRNSTHFITSRETISLECIDRLWDTDVKIISALDDGIFDGEPGVQWDKIFGSC